MNADTDATGATDDLAAAARAARRRVMGRESALSAVANGLTEPYMIPYALALGASPFQAGLVSSLRNVLVAVVQLGSGTALRWTGSRRKLVRRTVAMHVAFLVLLATFVPLLETWSVAVLIACYGVGTAVTALGLPAWGSLLAEGAEEREHGRFIGRRRLVVGLWTTVATLLAGGLLALCADRPVVGFALLCLGAAASRYGAFRTLGGLEDVPGRQPTGREFSFWRFLAQIRTSNFARFTVALGGANFATHLAAPFFAVFLLQEQRYDYLSYSLVILTGGLAGSLASTGWGMVGDRIGHRAVVRLGLAGTVALPVLWLLAVDARWMAALNAAGAVLWSGVNVSSIGFLYGTVTPPKRHTCLAYFNVVNGLAVGAGALVGGWIVLELPIVAGSAYAALFAASTALRLVAAGAFIGTVDEVPTLRRLQQPPRVLDLAGQRLVAILDPPDDGEH